MAVGNIVRRVLRIIREEYKSIPEEASSLGGPAAAHALGEDTMEEEEEISIQISDIFSFKTYPLLC